VTSIPCGIPWGNFANGASSTQVSCGLFRSGARDRALVSILAHVGLVWFAAGVTEGGRQVPTDEREARVFFLLPPDRMDVRSQRPTP
jgi:hypothetical protein